VQGRRVREYVQEDLKPGAWSVVWNGRREDGTRASAVVYFYSVESERSQGGGGQGSHGSSDAIAWRLIESIRSRYPGRRCHLTTRVVELREVGGSAAGVRSGGCRTATTSLWNDLHDLRGR